MKKLFLLLAAIVLMAVGASAQTQTITGTVYSTADGEPLIGATVTPVGGGQPASTDVSGSFHLVIPKSVTKVTVTYVGMKSKTVAVSPKMEIYLEPTEASLQEVVVTGYGSGKKLGTVVGSVSVVNSQAIENTPSSNFVDALQGQVAGLNIFSSTGEPSSVPSSIRIRGVNSIEAGNTPLFILDGAPVSSSIFTTLNPTDIESVTVLKDAASVAIYGSRAANGVIVITSKKGVQGQKGTVTIRANYGWSSMVPDNLDMMDSKQYVQFRDMIGLPVADDIKTLVKKYGVNTNWRDEIFDGHAPTYSIEGAVSGGSANSSYYVSLNHYDAEGIITQSGMRRESLRANLRASVNEWLTVGFQSNLGYTKYENNYFSDNSMNNNWNNPMTLARWMVPYQASRYYTIENDKIVYGDRADYLWTQGLFLPSYLASTRDFKKSKVTANMVLFEEIRPVKGLTLRAQQAVDAFEYRLEQVQYPGKKFVTPMGHTADLSSLTGSNLQSFQRYYSFTYTNTAEYRFNVADVNHITLLAGQESIITRSKQFGVVTTGQTDPRQMLLTNGTNVAMSGVSNSISEEVFNSYFLTGSYDYDNRYFFDATYRRDGSSKFAPGHRWSNFWSVGGMWDLKNEEFLQEPTWLSNLQLSLSYGTVGNSSISNYMYYGTVGTGSAYNGAGSLGLGNAPNPDLTWETVKSWDLGLNIGFFDRYHMAVDFYHKKTCDMLMDIPYSYTTGYSSGYGNIGSMKNVGVDLEFNADIVKTQDWYVGARVNFNYNKNEITELFNGQDKYVLNNTGLQLTVGHPYGEFLYVKYAGVDPRDGKQMWYDKNGNLTKEFNEERDAVLTGKCQYAPWTGGWGLDIRWKDLSLRMDWNWAAKKYMLNNELYFVENASMAADINQTTSMLNIWTKPGQITDIPAYGQEIQFDTRFLEDASYMRLKNITVNYNLPKTIISKLGVKQLGFHFTGRNLLTFTGFRGYDPEPERNLVLSLYPNTRQYEFGVEITF